jgi:peptide/nickel transport system ATP-binding protein
MDKPLLEVRHLAIDFAADGNKTTAVKGSSFSVFPGEILAIVGESGSGKSVTALSLMRLLPGSATIQGNLFFSTPGHQLDLLELPEKEMSRIRGKDIAMIFQEPMTSLNPVFTCGYQVMEAIRLHQQLDYSAAKEKTIAVFEKVKLPNPAEIMNRYPHELSGGQKQRVMIAMAISCDPVLLIADEPTTALDVTVQKSILALLKQLQLQSGMGVIFITHDLGLVADIADRVLVMYKGEIAEQGYTSSLLEHPQHPYTRALLACRPGLHQRGERLPVVSDFLQDDGAAKATSLPVIAQESAVGPTGPITAETVLTVERLSVHFPARKALFTKRPAPLRAVDDVSFTVRKGETIGLVGESGCGKTTLGRAILRLIPASSGRILLHGEDLAGITGPAMRAARKDLQVVFQDPFGSLNPRLTIGAAIREPMRVHRLLENDDARNERVLVLLEKVNLKAAHFNRYPHQFSGGQRQRICIARALALNPSFLVFDESVSALDVSVQAQVLNLLNDLKREFAFTSIFISHDLSVVRFISDRILVMNKGRIVEQGPSDEIWTAPKNEYTRKLIAAIPGKALR